MGIVPRDQYGIPFGEGDDLGRGGVVAPCSHRKRSLSGRPAGTGNMKEPITVRALT